MSKSKAASTRMGKAHSQQRGVSLLAVKWEREGRQMIKLANAEPSVEGDMALRNAGAARLKCAKELRAEMRKQANAPDESPQKNL